MVYSLRAQVVTKLWRRAFPLLHGMGVWMVNTVGEPPPDVNARVLVRTEDNCCGDPSNELKTD